MIECRKEFHKKFLEKKFKLRPRLHEKSVEEENRQYINKRTLEASFNTNGP